MPGGAAEPLECLYVTPKGSRWAWCLPGKQLKHLPLTHRLQVQVWREYTWREDPVDGLVGSRPSSSASTSSGDNEAGSSAAIASSSSSGDAPSGGAAGAPAAAEEVEEVQLHVLTAERIHVGGSLPDFVDVYCTDGCPGGQGRGWAGRESAGGGLGCPA